jgi:hypothetical protein
MFIMFDGSSSAMEFEVTNTTNTFFFYAQIQIQMLCDNTTTVFSAQRRPSSSLTGTSLHLTSNIFHSSTFFLTTLFFSSFLQILPSDLHHNLLNQPNRPRLLEVLFLFIHSFIIHLSLLSIIIIEIEALFFIRLYWIWAGFPKLVISANTETTI